MSFVLARATFTATLDEVAEVAWREARRCRPAWREFAWRIVAVALGTAAAVLVVLWTVHAWVAPERTVSRAIAIVVAVLTARALSRSTDPRRVERARLRKQHGDGPFPCTVELDENGFSVRRLGSELRVPWTEVAEVKDDGADFVLAARPALVVVRSRGFPDAAARAHFVATARRLHQAARTSAAVATADADVQRAAP